PSEIAVTHGAERLKTSVALHRLFAQRTYWQLTRVPFCVQIAKQFVWIAQTASPLRAGEDCASVSENSLRGIARRSSFFHYVPALHLLLTNEVLVWSARSFLPVLKSRTRWRQGFANS